MYDIFIAGTVLVPLLILALTLLRRKKPEWPVERKPLMTRRELEAFKHLRNIFPDHHIAPQVAMGAIIETTEGLTPSVRQSVRNKFDRKITDFVVIDPDNGKVDFIIEIDDSTHRADKDAERDSITRAAGYKTIRHPARSKVNRASLEKTIRTALAR